MFLPRLLLCLIPAVCAAQESGTLLLRFIQLPVGQETYEVEPAPGSLNLRSTFNYTERGTKIALKATLRMRPDLTPLEFEANGKSYRPFSVDAAFKIDPGGQTATVREGALTRHVTLEPRYFTLSGYTPLAVQMMLVRYWQTHGRPARLTQYPGNDERNSLAIAETGRETIEVDGHPVRLVRYSLANVVWGAESLWLNERGEIAGATTYAGGLPFEAVREEYAAALPQLIRSSVADRIRELRSLSASIQPLMGNRYAVTGVRLIDGVSAAAIEDSTVIVRDGRIEAAGPRSRLPVPRGYQTIDGRGKTLLPGLWEMHAHFAQTDYGPVYLAAGVTTARDCGGEFEFITAVRDAINRDGALGPHLLLAGLVDGSGPGTFGTTWADTPEQGRAAVAKFHAAGFDQMKVYTLIRPPVLRAIAEAAHSSGMTVTGHVPQGMTALEGVEAGMDQINHFGPVAQALHKAAAGLPVDFASPAVRAVVQFFLDHHTVVDPTFAWGELLGRRMDVPIASFEPGFAKAPYTLTSVIDTSGTPVDAPRREAPDDSPALLRGLYLAGIPIVAGTDKAIPGHSLHRELELYVAAGLTPMQVIQLATSGSARVMGLDRETGSIAAGKRADMLLVDGNPLTNFADLRRVHRVVRAGQVYDPAPLWKAAGFQP